jgi:glycerol-3-phosphate acyltransferase PlsY
MPLDIGFIVLSYLVGSVSTAIVLCKAMGQPDPRTLGSGNPGATNVLRFGGKRLAAATLIGDVLKGLFPVLIAKPFVHSPTMLASVAFAAVVGHVFPIYYRFKGGKGVATGLGVLLGVSWPSALAALAVWSSVLAITRVSSLSAILGAVVLPLLVYWLDPHIEYTWFAVAISLLLLWRHRQNINNLLAGREGRVGASRDTKGMKHPTED